MNDHRVPLFQRVVSIRTPENIELAYALAGPGSRAAAYVVDLLIMSVICQVLINLLAYVVMLLFSTFGVQGGLWVSAIVTLVAFTLYNGYFILLEWLWNGQTPGKRLLHIRVIKQGGYALRFFDTLLRNLLRVVDFLPLFYGVGLTSLLLTRDSQRLGDLIAGTLNDFGIGEDLLGIDSFVGVALEVGHLTVMLRGQPLLEPRRVRGRGCRRETAGVETEFARALLDGRVHRAVDCIRWNW
jgi:uncharacterized RDD family membrane protein YckC